MLIHCLHSDVCNACILYIPVCVFRSQQIHDDGCSTVRIMADAFEVYQDTIHKMVVEDLGKKNVPSRFVSESLFVDQNYARVECGKDSIKYFKLKKKKKKKINRLEWMMKPGVFLLRSHNEMPKYSSHHHHQKVNKINKQTNS